MESNIAAISFKDYWKINSIEEVSAVETTHFETQALDIVFAKITDAYIKEFRRRIPNADADRLKIAILDCIIKLEVLYSQIDQELAAVS